MFRPLVDDVGAPGEFDPVDHQSGATNLVEPSAHQPADERAVLQ